MMYSYLAAAALAGSVSASVLPRTDGCCFQLTASGEKSGTIGQLYDGQNRIGGGYAPATYCITNGEITDSSGRGCILTPPTTQLQCDVGATPTSGFSISGSGEVEYMGSGKFYACGASASEYNLYTKPVENQKDCHEVKLSSGGKCASNGGGGGAGKSPSAPPPKQSTASAPASMHPAPSKPALTVVTITKTAKACPSAAPPASSPMAPASSPMAPASSPKAPASSAPAYSMSKSAVPPADTPASPPAVGSACQTSLTGAYQTPHLIVPISSEKPDVAQGTSYFGEISSTTSTIFNFDVPAEYAGKQCSIVFLFPEKKDLTTADYTFSGSGSLGCSELSSAATQKTSYSNAPSVAKHLGDVAIKPGNSYVVATGDCKAGTTQSIELSSKGGLSLNFFEDYNPSPLGLFMTSC